MSKRLLISVLGLFLLGTLSADAKICIGCSSDIPDTANFCSICLTPQPMAVTLGQQNRQKEPREVVLDMFAFIDQYQAVFNDMQYLNILGKMPEIKTKFQNASVRYRNIEKMLPEECKLLANIYAAKYQLIDGVTSVMKNLRIDSGYRNALLKSALMVMSYYNDIIAQFRVPRVWDKANIEQLKKQIKNVSDRTKKYQVTSEYLKMDETKVRTGENIMVMTIGKDKKAFVMYMGPSMTHEPVTATIPLSTLAKRTTWKKENAVFFEDIKLAH